MDQGFKRARSLRRQVLHAARLIAQHFQDEHGSKAGSGLGWCAEVLRAAACSDLADEACLMQANALLRAGDLSAAGSLLLVRAWSAAVLQQQRPSSPGCQ